MRIRKRIAPPHQHSDLVCYLPVPAPSKKYGDIWESTCTNRQADTKRVTQMIKTDITPTYPDLSFIYGEQRSNRKAGFANGR
jgi:hypothetical protein